MPITFAPADPYNPQISFESGQRQQTQQEFENFQAAQRAAAAQYFQQANLDQNADQFNRQQDFQQQRLDQSNEQFRVQQEPSARDRFMGEQEIKQMKARADIGLMMKDQEFTQRQRVELQQQQNALADVEAAVKNGTLLPDEAKPLIFQIKTGVDVLKQRDNHQRVQIQEQAIKERIKQNEIETDMEAQRRKNLTEMGVGFTKTFPNGAVGQLNSKGDFEYPKELQPPPPPKPSDLMKLHEQAKEIVDGMRDRSGNLIAGTGMLTPTEPVWQPGAREQQIEIEFNKLKEKFGIGGGQQQQAAPGQPAMPAQPPQPPPQPQPTAPQNGQPLPPDPKQWTPVQQTHMKAMDDDLKALATKPLDPKVKAAAIASLEEAKKIYQITGGVMDADAHARYKKHLLDFNALSQ